MQGCKEQIRQFCFEWPNLKIYFSATYSVKQVLDTQTLDLAGLIESFRFFASFSIFA